MKNRVLDFILVNIYDIEGEKEGSARGLCTCTRKGEREGRSVGRKGGRKGWVYQMQMTVRVVIGGQ